MLSLASVGAHFHAPDRDFRETSCMTFSIERCKRILKIAHKMLERIQAFLEDTHRDVTHLFPRTGGYNKTTSGEIKE